NWKVQCSQFIKIETDGNFCSAQASGGSFNERDIGAEFRSPQANMAAISVGKKVRYYKMDHERRGSAIIFNHEHFTISGLKKLRGTQTDCENLKLQLESLYFDVVVHNDLDYKNVRRRVIAGIT
ncbi:Peptidase, partial [Oryctes borbonicus]